MASQHQHDCLTVGLGGLYPCPEVVREVLAPLEDESKRKSVLDLGTSSLARLSELLPPRFRSHIFSFSSVTPLHRLRSPFWLSFDPPHLRGKLRRNVSIIFPQDGFADKFCGVCTGCGNGAWLVDMAYEFPHVDFLGVDLIPCPAADAPSNVSFEIDDINHGLEHFAGKFDLVHARMISFGIKNYRKTMEEISRCVKPGGLVILMEADMELLGVDRMTVLPMALTEREMLDARAEARISGPIPGLSNDDEDETSGVEMRGSWLQRLLYEMRYATRLNGSDFTCAEDAVDEGLWRMHIFDPDTCGASSLYIPITPWPQMRDQALSQQLKYAGSLMRQDIYNALRATQPLFRKHGVSQAVIDQWVAAADYDLMAETFRAWVRFRIAWGRRRSSTSLSNSPPLASFPQDEKEKDTVPNHQVEVYQTLQESMIAKALRMSSRVSKPIPFLAQLAQGKNISL